MPTSAEPDAQIDSDATAPGDTAAEPRRALAVLDVDGVLADVRHRLHHLGKRPKDWEAFFGAAADDPLLADGAVIAAELAGTYELLYLTGRPERTRPLTERWLTEKGLPAGQVLMRPDSDHRAARMFKRERLRQLRDDREVVLVVDDDPEVIAVLRTDGFATRLADWLPYADPLRDAQQGGRT